MNEIITPANGGIPTNDYDLMSRQMNNTPLYHPVTPILSLQTAMQTGGLPFDYIMSKYDETYTDIDNSEHDYDYFSRMTLTDRRPDTPYLESDRPRNSYYNGGRLNLTYYGGRGKENNPNHSELFLGETLADGEKVNNEPDLSKLRAQQESRNRLMRLYPDADNSITSGGLSPAGVRDAKNASFRATRPRLKIFSTTKDCRREGLRRDHMDPNNLNKIVRVDSYGEMIKDQALNPQKQTTKISNHLYRSSRLYNMITPDHEFYVAQYGENPRRGKLTGLVEPTMTKYLQEGPYTGEELKMLSEDPNVCYKAAALQVCKSVNELSKGDVDYQESDATKAYKSSSMRDDMDLRKVMEGMNFDTDFKCSTFTKVFKSKAKEAVEAIGRLSSTNDRKNAMHYIDAVKMYKSVNKEAKPGIHEGITFDQDKTESTATVTAKSSMKEIRELKRNSIASVHGTSMNTLNYKTKINQKIKDAKLLTKEKFGDESKNTNAYKNPMKESNTGVAPGADFDNDEQFYDNKSKDRHVRGMGGKYLRDTIDRESNEALTTKVSA
jgi:hypothetical protein